MKAPAPQLHQDSSFKSCSGATQKLTTMRSHTQLCPRAPETTLRQGKSLQDRRPPCWQHDLWHQSSKTHLPQHYTCHPTLSVRHSATSVLLRAEPISAHPALRACGVQIALKAASNRWPVPEQRWSKKHSPRISHLSVLAALDYTSSAVFSVGSRYFS